MARTKTMKALEEMLAERQAQLTQLRTEIALLEDAIRRTSGEPEKPQKQRAARSNVKSLVLDLLKEVGADGLNAGIAVDLAQKRGDHLERGSVSSLLSRLKSEGTVTYDGSVYRLSQFSSDSHERDTPSAAVFAHPASRVAP